MGGRSSSKTVNTTEIDNRQLAVQDGIGGFAEGDQTFNVTTTDFGAVDRAFDSTDRTVAGAFDFGRRLQSETEGTMRQAFEGVKNAFDGAQKIASGAMRGESGEAADTTRTIIYVGGAVAGIALIYVIMRSR